MHGTLEIFTYFHYDPLFSPKYKTPHIYPNLANCRVFYTVMMRQIKAKWLQLVKKSNQLSNIVVILNYNTGSPKKSIPKIKLFTKTHHWSGIQSKPYCLRLYFHDFVKFQFHLILCSSSAPIMALQYTQHGPSFGYILNSNLQKWDQGTLGTKRSPLIGCRTRLGPSMDSTMALQYT